MPTIDTLWDSLNDPMARELLNLRVATSILDVGCGSGMWTATLLRLRKAAWIVGVDSDRSALERASKNLRREADLVLAEATQLPFKGGSFDLVTCRRLLINIERGRRRKATREMTRVANSGGTVSSVEPSLHVDSATHFTTLKGGLAFSRRLEKTFTDTDFELGPEVAHLYLSEGLENVKVNGYLSVQSTLPPKFETSRLNSIVHTSFKDALSEVECGRIPFRRRGPLKSDVKNLRKEADRLDREMKKQKENRAFVNVSAIPMFITSGTKRVQRR